MNPSDIKKALTGMAAQMKNNPELMIQQIEMFKAFYPNIDEASLKKIVEKVSDANFNPRSLEDEVKKMMSSMSITT